MKIPHAASYSGRDFDLPAFWDRYPRACRCLSFPALELSGTDTDRFGPSWRTAGGKHTLRLVIPFPGTCPLSAA